MSLDAFCSLIGVVFDNGATESGSLFALGFILGDGYDKAFLVTEYAFSIFGIVDISSFISDGQTDFALTFKNDCFSFVFALADPATRMSL